MAAILLVDDDADIRRVFALALKHMGHTVTMGSNGEEACELAASLQPNLILMDLNMPVLDGWKATELIKAQPALAHIPVIAVTAHGYGAEYDRAIAAGCDLVLTKPVEILTLMQTIQRFLKA